MKKSSVANLEIIEAVKKYANELGWKIFPTHGISGDNCDCKNPNCLGKGKRPYTKNGYKDASSNLEQIAEWWKAFPTANVALSTGKDNNLFVLDIDIKNNGIETLRNKIENHGAIPRTVQALTGGGGFHYFFSYNEKIKTRTNVFSGIDIRADGGYAVIPPSEHITGTRYRWINNPNETVIASAPEWLINLLVGSRGSSASYKTVGEDIPEGNRNSALASLCGGMRSQGLTKDAILAAILKENEVRCKPPLAESEVTAIVDSINKYPVNVRTRTVEAPRGGENIEEVEVVEVPEEEPEMHPIAYRGIIREYVDALKEYTEASDAGLLFSFLIAFGNIINRNAHFKYSQTLHYANEYLVLVGESSKARKGTTLDHMRALFINVDPEWTKTRWLTSVASGEGLISLLSPSKEKGSGNFSRFKGLNRPWTPSATINEEENTDKRLLLTLTEFSSILQIMKRPGSTVSSVIRDAWDHGLLQNNTKWAAARVEDAHVSCIGHITMDELKFELDRVEFANGFANRFLWAYTKRSKLLPDSTMPEGVLSSVLPCIKGTIENCNKSSITIKKTTEAAKLWQRVYPVISSSLPGVLGAITARAEAHIMRIALIYTLLDRAAVIGKAQLQAALAVWKYNLDTCALVFGDFIGNRTADEILAALKTTSSGMTKQDMRKLSYSITGPQIDVSLQLLKRSGMVRSVCKSTAAGNTIIWFYKPNKRSGEDLQKYIEE